MCMYILVISGLFLRKRDEYLDQGQKLKSVAMLSIAISSVAILVIVGTIIELLSYSPECFIDVRYASGDNFTDYNNCSDQNIPQNGIEGHLYLPTPADACSYISPPPGGFPTNSTWIALVYDYPACPTEMVINIRNAGYTLIIAASKNDSHLTVTGEVSDTLFPIVVVEENYADYLKENAVSFSIDNPVFVHAASNLELRGSLAFPISITCLFVLFTAMMPCYRCNIIDYEKQLQKIKKWSMARQLQKIKNLRDKFEEDTCVIHMDELVDDQVCIVPSNDNSHYKKPLC